MTAESFEEKVQQAETLWGDTPAVPESSSWWGLYSCNDAPGVFADGYGSFVWFETRSEMIDFLEIAFAYTALGVKHSQSELASKISNVTKQLKSRKISDENAVSDFNEILQSEYLIEWIGKFEDLTQGDHPYALKTRAEFWAELEDGEGGHTRPIDADNMQAFKEFIEFFGA